MQRSVAAFRPVCAASSVAGPQRARYPKLCHGARLPVSLEGDPPGGSGGSTVKRQPIFIHVQWAFRALLTLLTDNLNRTSRVVPPFAPTACTLDPTAEANDVRKAPYASDAQLLPRLCGYLS